MEGKIYEQESRAIARKPRNAAMTLLPEFSSDDIAAQQAEDTEMGDAYWVMHEGTDFTSDEQRSFALESRHLLSLRPSVRLENGLMVKVDEV